MSTHIKSSQHAYYIYFTGLSIIPQSFKKKKRFKLHTHSHDLNQHLEIEQ